MKKICGNCTYWDCDNRGEGKYLISHIDTKTGFKVAEKFSPCLISAVEPDAGNAIALMACNGHCEFHKDAFEPSEFYLEELEEAHIDDIDLYGVKPGRDFPGTLF